jgi:hypothetical protein
MNHIRPPSTITRTPVRPTSKVDKNRVRPGGVKNVSVQTNKNPVRPGRQEFVRPTSIVHGRQGHRPTSAGDENPLEAGETIVRTVWRVDGQSSEPLDGGRTIVRTVGRTNISVENV